MLLIKYNLEIVQRRMRGPQFSGKRIFLRRDREQEHVIDRQHGPDEHGNADQQKPCLGTDIAQGRELHRDSRFIMKKTSGSTSGSAQTIAAIDISSWSSRK